MNTSPPPWIEIAEGEIGIKEAVGRADHPRIIEYLETTTIGSPHDQNDETPWCSAFVNWVMIQVGHEGTNSAAAISWRSWGTPLYEPKAGAICILKRPGGHHVGFVTSWNAESVLLLGGNQSDQVKISPYDRDMVIGYRWPGG